LINTTHHQFYIDDNLTFRDEQSDWATACHTNPIVTYQPDFTPRLNRGGNLVALKKYPAGNKATSTAQKLAVAWNLKQTNGLRISDHFISCK
jgi:hypothetical protein